MKTSKVKSVENVKEWSNGNGTVYYHNLVMENGDKINLGKKSQLSAGVELNYEIVDQDGTSEFHKAKTVNPEQGNFNQSYGNNKGSDNKDLQILFSVCLKAATDLYSSHSMQIPNAQELVSYAEELTKSSLKSLEDLK